MPRQFQLQVAFAQLPYRLMDEAPDPYVEAVYTRAFRHGANSPGCWCSIATLAHEARIGERVVRRSLQWLEENGWLEAERRPGYTTLWRVMVVPARRRSTPARSATPGRSGGGDPLPISKGTPGRSARGPLADQPDEKDPKKKIPRTRRTPRVPTGPLAPQGGQLARQVDCSRVNAAEPLPTGSLPQRKPEGGAGGGLVPQEQALTLLAGGRQADEQQRALPGAPGSVATASKAKAPKAARDPLASKQLPADAIPPDLAHLAEKLADWWAVKRAGSRSSASFRLACGKLRQVPHAAQELMLDNAIIGGWQGLYPPKPQDLAAANPRLQHLQGARPSASQVAVANFLDWADENGIT